MLLYYLNITHTPHCVLRATKKKTITTTLKQASRFGLIHKKNMYVYVMYVYIYIFTLNATVVVEDFRFICLLWVWVYRGVCIYILYNCHFAMLRRLAVIAFSLSFLAPRYRYRYRYLCRSCCYITVYMFTGSSCCSHETRSRLTWHASCRTLWQRLLVLFPTGRCLNGRRATKNGIKNDNYVYDNTIDMTGYR